MVIGKKHRLKLRRKDEPVRRRIRASVVQRARAIKAKSAPRPAPEPIAKPGPVPGGIHILELESHHCRAVLGYGPDGFARHCGAPKEGLFLAAGGQVVQSAFCHNHGTQFYQRANRND